MIVVKTIHSIVFVISESPNLSGFATSLGGAGLEEGMVLCVGWASMHACTARTFVTFHRCTTSMNS